jgi:prophage regulatory protein
MSCRGRSTTTPKEKLMTTRYLRLKQIIGDLTATPPIPPIIPISRSCWYAGIKAGRFPSPSKLGPRLSVWSVSDVMALIHNGKDEDLK